MKRSRLNLSITIAFIAIVTGLILGYNFIQNSLAAAASSNGRYRPAAAAGIFSTASWHHAAAPATAAQKTGASSVFGLKTGTRSGIPKTEAATRMNGSVLVSNATPVRSLLGSAVTINAPDVKAGNDLWASAEFSNIPGRMVCSVDWFYDGAPMEGNCGGYLLLEDGTSVAAGADIEFSEDMPLEHTIGLMLTYTDPATGHIERLYNEANVTVHNYSKAYYIAKQNEEAIRNASSSSEVSCVYRGNYSSSYDADYSDEVKTAFINDGGYSSETSYLVWVNLATQKVNIFSGSRGSWQLIHTYRCATGAPDTPTPTGVTYTTYKQTGWITDEYQVKYVTRFYPGSGYAFHSILYTPDGSSVLSGAVGYPKSHGCVRTEDEGVRWIYNNLPAHSTVVIY